MFSHKTAGGHKLVNVMKIKADTLHGPVTDVIIGRVESGDKWNGTICIEDGEYVGTHLGKYAYKKKDGTIVLISKIEIEMYKRHEPHVAPR